MKTRIRHISRRRNGVSVQDELVTDKHFVTIGRATNQDIFLPDMGVAYHHARITLSSGGQIGISSQNSAGVYVNGKFVQSGSLKNNGSFQVGPFEIEINQDVDGFDFDITVEKVAQDVIEVVNESLPPMTLEETWLSRRRQSWFVALLVLLVFLCIPLAGYFNNDFAQQARESAYIPDDGLWQSGAISSPHKHFGDNCNSCHLKAFEMVPDKACVDCHTDTTVHADPVIFDLHDLQGVRCASCHKEHNETEFLTRRDQYLCADCHRDLSDRVETDLEDISDFSEQHAEFKPLLFTAKQKSIHKSASGGNDWQRISLDNTNAMHETGIKFPHDIHLDVNGLDSPTGSKVLQCNSCHETDVSGRYMKPLEFEKHCQSCHKLTFDTNTPDRELPHSDLDTLSSTLNEYYAFMALRGNYEDDDEATPDVITRRRIPGKELTSVEKRLVLSWAKEKSEDVKEEIIEFRTCVQCHKVERDKSEASGWRIPKVQVSQRWFTKGAFDHAAHTSTDCEDCHQASLSKRSEDPLMPNIKVCRECHGGEDADDKLDSGCVTCHVFHTHDAELLGNRNNGNNH